MLARTNQSRARVFNIEVEGAHAYYAGGLLVSNCEAGQYMVLGAGEGTTILQSTSARSDMDVAGFRQMMGYS